MEAFLNKEQPEDELVRIRAESLDLICLGFQHGNLEMPDHVVPLSKAIERMDAFCKEVTEGWYKEMQGENVLFHVYACKDGFHLFDYMNGEISEDHRKDERPKSPDRVHFRLMDGGKTPPVVVRYVDKPVYAEWAEREMDKYMDEYMEYFVEKHQRIRQKGWEPEEINQENLYFDVYNGEYGDWYLYSYQNGQKFERTLTKEEQEEKKEWQERLKKVVLKVMIHNQNPPQLYAEYDTNVELAELYIHRYRNDAKDEKKEEDWKQYFPERIFFETYDAETGAFLKRYRIVGDKLESSEE